MSPRPIEPAMQLLHDRLELIAEGIDRFIEAMVGEHRGYTLMVHPKEEGFASLSVSNITNNLEVVRAWVAAHETR